MADLLPSTQNPIIITRDAAGDINVAMLPIGGASGIDRQRFRLTNRGAAVAVSGGAPVTSHMWGIDGLGAIIGGVDITFISRDNPEVDTIFESVAQVYPVQDYNRADPGWTGSGHGRIFRTQVLAFANSGAPEFFGNITPQSVTLCNHFYLHQTFECRFADGTPWGTYQVWHNFGQFGGVWGLRVETRWTPLAPVYLRNCYDLMSSAENSPIMLVDGAPSSRTFYDGATGLVSNYGLTRDFGKAANEISFMKDGGKMTARRALPSLNSTANMQSGMGHLQHHVPDSSGDVLDKVRLSAVSRSVPQLMTTPLRTLVDYSMSAA